MQRKTILHGNRFPPENKIIKIIIISVMVPAHSNFSASGIYSKLCLSVHAYRKNETLFPLVGPSHFAVALSRKLTVPFCFLYEVVGDVVISTR
jgi:hypothetical protein